MAKTTDTKVVKLKLDQLLRIKEDLEGIIKQDEYLMRKNNSRPKDEEAQIDFIEVKTKYERELEQLVLVKDAIRTGNAILDENNHPNDHNVYLLSNLNRRKAFLNSLNTFEGKRTTMKSQGKEIAFSVKLSYKEAEKELKQIEIDIRELENKLSVFNHSTEVSVILYNDLSLA